MTTAILFPGQGAQTVGMGMDFAKLHPAASRVFDEANAVLGYDVAKLCFEGPAEDLVLTTHAQPAIFVTSIAVVAALRERGRLPAISVAAGLSLGEYTAVHFAGCLGFQDALRLVKRRGAAMQKAADLVPSGMVSLLGADLDTARRVADRARGDGILVVANVNAPGQIVLSGDLEACGRVADAAKELKVRRATPLQVAGAFHSPLMAPARQELESALADVPIADAKIPVVSNVTAAPVTKASDIRDLLARQLTSAVLWDPSIRAMAAMGVTRYLEPAPGNVLSGLAKRIVTDARTSSVATAGDIETIEP